MLRRPFEPRQYAAGDYRDILQAAAIIQSMSRKANCWDNAPMESFFGTLKTELVHHRQYPDRDTARRDLFAYIEGYYNRRRIHSAIGYLTPQLLSDQVSANTTDAIERWSASDRAQSSGFRTPENVDRYLTSRAVHPLVGDIASPPVKVGLQC